MRGLYLIRPLEHALRFWEVECWVHHVLLPRMGVIPQLMPEVFSLYPKLRAHLRRAWSGDAFDERFVLEGKEADQYLQYTATLPMELWNWMRVRRVYHLTEGAQEAFAHSRYKGITWGDVMLPLPCFGVALEKAIIADDGHLYSFILVTRDEETGTTLLRLLSQRVEMIEQVTPRLQFEIERLVQQGRIKDAQSEMAKKVYPVFDTVQWSIVVSKDLSALPIESPLENHVLRYSYSTRTKYPEWNAMTKVLAGLCLWLTTGEGEQATYHHEQAVQEGGVSRKKRKKTPATVPQITDDAWVCAVGSSWTVQMNRMWQEDEGVSLSSNRGHRKSPRPHPRQGVWCFPKGTKGKPGAAKVQWRRPTFVRAHAIAPGELPPGALVKLKQ